MPTAAELDEAVRLLEAGELVAFPTETVYGLGADAENPKPWRASSPPRADRRTIR
jgi:L-threonylcarbamoyladenylate synthase